MPIMTFAQQVSSHLDFLRANRLVVDELAIDVGFVRCRSVDESSGRGECVYKTVRNAMMKQGMVGLATWCRVSSGQTLNHKTYGIDGEASEDKQYQKLGKHKAIEYSEEVTARCDALWDSSKRIGCSDYLVKKGVGAYGIRFLGSTAVVPAYDSIGVMRSIQFLNQDGQKRFMEGSTISGLFHSLGEPKNGQFFGIAESYVTAATCYELSGIPVICAFSGSNLVAVAKTFRERCPDSRIIIFGDNDRHLVARRLDNVGRKYAERAAAAICNSISIFPEFENIPPAKDASDWNDLACLKGREIAKQQLYKYLAK